MRAALVLVALAACDPIYGAHVRLKAPGAVPVEGALVAIACSDTEVYSSASVGRTDKEGVAFVGSLGTMFPPGCDLYLAKPGFATRRIRYREICPNGPDECDRVQLFDLAFVPAR